MFYLALSDSFEYLCFGSTTIRNIVILSVRGPSLNVRIGHRRQSLTYKEGPRAERVKVNLYFENPHYCMIIVSRFRGKFRLVQQHNQ